MKARVWEMSRIEVRKNVHIYELEWFCECGNKVDEDKWIRRIRMRNAVGRGRLCCDGKASITLPAA